MSEFPDTQFHLRAGLEPAALSSLDIDVDGWAPRRIIAMHEAYGFCGCVDLTFKDRVAALIENLFVLPALRKMGIGRQLVSACMEMARLGGCESLGLHSLKANAFAGFYRRLGFRISYEYENGDRLMTMELN
jgi:ribosomal protein S18 acetylase RimI-like enzyme